MALLRIIDEGVNPTVRASDVSKIIEATEPMDVRLDEVHAGPVGAVGDAMQMDLGRGEPGYAIPEDEDVILVRLEHTLTCAPEGVPESTTSIQASHVVAFSVNEPLEVNSATISAWIETNAYFIVYPYVRQFFTQMTATLGLPPLVLGYMKRDQWPFSDEAQGE